HRVALPSCTGVRQGANWAVAERPVSWRRCACIIDGANDPDGDDQSLARTDFLPSVTTHEVSRYHHTGTERDEMILQDKVAVIYGAGGGIGGAVARVFAGEGAKVFLTGRSLAPVEAGGEGDLFPAGAPPGAEGGRPRRAG